MMMTNRNKSVFMLVCLVIGFALFAFQYLAMVQVAPHHIEAGNSSIDVETATSGYSINLELTITDATSRALLNTYTVAQSDDRDPEVDHSEPTIDPQSNRT